MSLYQSPPCLFTIVTAMSLHHSHRHSVTAMSLHHGHRHVSAPWSPSPPCLFTMVTPCLCTIALPCLTMVTMSLHRHVSWSPWSPWPCLIVTITASHHSHRHVSHHGHRHVSSPWSPPCLFTMVTAMSLHRSHP